MSRFIARRSLLTLAAAAVVTLPSVALAGDGENWIKDDLAKAKTVAAAEGKDILIDFTGSDWCGWCIRLDKEVFAQSQFKAEAPKDFVLVALDFPTDKVPQTAEVKAANRKAGEAYGIQGYPTIILADSTGAAYARTGYRDGGAGPYMKHLGELRKGKQMRDAYLADAKTASGVAKARLLDQALSVKDIIVPNEMGLMAEIVALDADNGAGLKAKYEAKLLEAKARGTMDKVNGMLGSGDAAGALKMLDGIEGLDRLSGEFRGEVASMKAMALFMSGDMDGMKAYVAGVLADTSIPVEARMQVSLSRLEPMMAAGDRAGAIAVFDETIALDPSSAFGQRLASQRPMLMNMLNERLGGADKVPHDHDGDGKPDHGPGEHGG